MGCLCPHNTHGQRRARGVTENLLRRPAFHGEPRRQRRHFGSCATWGRGAISAKVTLQSRAYERVSSQAPDSTVRYVEASGLKISLPFVFFCILLSQRLLPLRCFHLFSSINLLPASSVHNTNTRRGKAGFLPGSTSSCVPVPDVLGAYGCLRALSTIRHSDAFNLRLPLHWETKGHTLESVAHSHLNFRLNILV